MRKREKTRASPEAGNETPRSLAHRHVAKGAEELGKRFPGLQRQAGNQAVLGLLASGAIRAKFRVSEPGDADEVEADRAAAQVASLAEQPAVHRAPATPSGRGPVVPDSLLESIGPGQPLDPATRAVMESRFGRDFSKVIIHTGDAAAASAEQLQARAYTADERIVFAQGQYSPSSQAGTRLLAHELAHVSQNQNARSHGVPATKIHRDSLVGAASNWVEEKKEKAGKWIEDKKWDLYRAMIAGLKAAKNANIAMLRALVPKLPTAFQSAASSIIDAVDFIVDLEIALLLAIIGLAVGFVEGLVGLVTGLVKLAMGFLKMMVDWLVSLMGKPEEYQKDVNDFVAAIKGIPPGLKQLFDRWVDRYKHATLEEQVLMGGELVGQVEAFIATFALAGAKAGQATTLTMRTGEFGMQFARQTGVAALERAPGVTVTIPAAVPQFGAEAVVVSSQVMAMSSSASGGGGTSGGGGGSAGKGPLHGATNEELDEAVKNMKPAGDPVQLQPHGAATDTRKALAVSGKDVQSAHGAPQKVMKDVPGYNPRHALTKLMDVSVHTGMDQFWKDAFQAMRRAGRTNATAQEIHDIVAESIQRAPGLSAGEKNSLIARLGDEMFVEFGLKPNDVLDLPYPNIGP
jgi:hypothetical protein